MILGLGLRDALSGLGGFRVDRAWLFGFRVEGSETLRIERVFLDLGFGDIHETATWMHGNGNGAKRKCFMVLGVEQGWLPSCQSEVVAFFALNGLGV